MNLQAVGCRPSDPNDELRLAKEANTELRETLKKMRTAYDQGQMRELDTELKNAWMIRNEVEQHLSKVNLQSVPASDLDKQQITTDQD